MEPRCTSSEVRERLVRTLRLDLVGPEPGSEHAAERLPMPPSRWYLTGFLVPFEAKEEPAADATAQDDLFVATRTTTLAGFGALNATVATNTTANEEGPRWAADGKTLYFDSTRGG